MKKRLAHETYEKLTVAAVYDRRINRIVRPNHATVIDRRYKHPTSSLLDAFVYFSDLSCVSRAILFCSPETMSGNVGP